MKQVTINEIEKLINRLENGNYTIKIIAETVKRLRMLKEKYIQIMEER
jgi:hypothetical protein